MPNSLSICHKKGLPLKSPSNIPSSPSSFPPQTSITNHYCHCFSYSSWSICLWDTTLLLMLTQCSPKLPLLPSLELNMEYYLENVQSQPSSPACWPTCPHLAYLELLRIQICEFNKNFKSESD